jgi:molybdate transport system substrate-binding protein
MFRKLESALLSLLTLAPSPSLAKDQQLTIAAASSLQDVLKAIDRALPADFAPEVKIAYNFGASSSLVRQIEAGAPIDVFFAADEANMDKLIQSGKIDAGTRRIITANEIVLIVKPAAPEDLVAKPEDLLKPEVKRLALCDPAVPIGHYAKQLLDRLGIYAKLESKMVRPDNARATFQAVASDAADAGFVYVTDVPKEAQIKVVYQAGAKAGLSILYPAAVVKASKRPEVARRFVEFLQSPAARKIFSDFGFAPTPAS